MQSTTVLNTRALNAERELSEFLRARGFRVLEYPMLEILPLEAGEQEQFRQTFTTLHKDDWLLFTSANGVAQVRAMLSAYDLSAVSCAAIGRQTARHAADAGFSVGFISPEANSEGFATEFISELKGQSARVGRLLLLRADIGSSVLPDELRRNGHAVEEIVVYRSRCPLISEHELSHFVSMFETSDERNGVDMIVVTSSQAAKNLVATVCQVNRSPAISMPAPIDEIPVAAIGKKTAATVRELGLQLAVVSPTAELEALADAVEAYFSDA